MKREMYYGYKFTDREELAQTISEYIEYCNYRRFRRRLKVMTPMEYHERFLPAA
ncbi:MAG: integrase core domain-containing protein [Oscillospiraceae bacterium]|nr:integrase core domain-containing protein [Oscillospiraceae bacterium]